jgi:hypothetical protein
MGELTHFKDVEMATVPKITGQLGNIVKLSDQRTDLASRVVKGADALSCCRSVETRSFSKATSIVNGILSLALETGTSQGIYIMSALPALAAEEGAAISVVTEATNIIKFPGVAQQTGVGASRLLVAGARSVLPGATLLLSGAQLAKVYAQYWVSELAGAIGLALSVHLDNERNSGQPDCYECLKKRVLSQDNPRKWEEAKIRRRI